MVTVQWYAMFQGHSTNYSNSLLFVTYVIGLVIWKLKVHPMHIYEFNKLYLIIVKFRGKIVSLEDKNKSIDKYAFGALDPMKYMKM